MRSPYFLVVHTDVEIRVEFRGGNHTEVFYGRGWNTERDALHAIALIDPTGVHPVKVRDERSRP